MTRSTCQPNPSVASGGGVKLRNSTGRSGPNFSASEATATYHLVPGTEALKPYENAAEVKAKFFEKKFKIAGGKVTAV